MSSSAVPQLVATALEAKKNSHAPYSGRHVGAAILTDRGTFKGATFENCAYPSSLCAVHCAIVNAVTSGAEQFIAVAVSGWREIEPANICGACRERLADFGDMQVYLHLGGTKGNYVASKLSAMLPRIGVAEGLGAISATPFTLGKRYECLDNLTFDDFELDPSQTATPEEIDLMKTAISACKYSYPVTSHFPVGAAVLTDMGVFAGANIESEVIGLGLCAERSTLAKAVSNGAKKIHALAITCFKLPDFGRPCGGCRQVLVEHGDYRIFQIKCDQEKRTFVYEPHQTTFSILPNCFSPAALESAN